jgi:hypothetical protein
MAPAWCAPLPGKPCTIPVNVNATDPDGDLLSYVWSGCATGTSRQVTCTVDRPGPVAATVDVSDGHGHTVRGTATGEGTNDRPRVSASCYPRPTGPTGALYGEFGYDECYWDAWDLDEGHFCGCEHCESITASGACRIAWLDCTCRSGPEVDVAWTALSGTCTVTFNIKDSWGLIGTTAVSFTYP